MVQKRKSTVKQPARQPAKKSKGSSGTGGIVITESAIVITLDAASRQKALRCLQKTGKITFSVEEHIATRLPQVLDNGKLID